MIALLFKCLLGALAVLLIALRSRSKSYFIAGLVPLFPSFALIAHAIVGSKRGAAQLRATALFGLCSLAPYAVYLLAVFWFSLRLTLTAMLASAALAWAVATGALLLLWNRVSPPAY
jgi:membrane protein GlpM